jgi:hypothetical protein
MVKFFKNAWLYIFGANAMFKGNPPEEAKSVPVLRTKISNEEKS